MTTICVFQEQQLIRLLRSTLGKTKLLFVCNKIDYEEENVRRDHGDGELEVCDDGRTILKMDQDHEEELPNKAQGTFQKLRTLAFVSDCDSMELCPSFQAVSARMVKKRRQSRSSEDPSTFFDHRYKTFCKQLIVTLESVLNRHVLALALNMTTAVVRIANGTIETRSDELAADERSYTSLETAATEEHRVYSKSLNFLSEHVKSIEDVVRKAITSVRPKVVENAKQLTHRDCLTYCQGNVRLLPLAYVEAITSMAGRLLHMDITMRIESLRGEYLQTFAFMFNVISGTILNDMLRCFFKPEEVKSFDCIQTDDTVTAAMDLFSLIPQSVALALENERARVLNHGLLDMVSTTLLRERIDENWKLSVAEAFLSSVSEKHLTESIVQLSTQSLHECHVNYVESHKKMMKLRVVQTRRSREDRLRLRTEVTPKVTLLLLQLHSLTCALEKGEPEKGAEIGQGRYSTIYTCLKWRGRKVTDKLVVKESKPLTPLQWTILAESYYMLQ